MAVRLGKKDLLETTSGLFSCFLSGSADPFFLLLVVSFASHISHYIEAMGVSYFHNSCYRQQYWYNN